MATEKLTLKKFQPTRDWLIVADPRKSTTDTGIILSEKTASSIQTNISKILAAGPECKQAKAGDTAMINPTTTGNIVEIDGTSYVMIPEHFCMGVWSN